MTDAQIAILRDFCADMGKPETPEARYPELMALLLEKPPANQPELFATVRDALRRAS